MITTATHALLIPSRLARRVPHPFRVDHLLTRVSNVSGSSRRRTLRCAPRGRLRRTAIGAVLGRDRRPLGQGPKAGSEKYPRCRHSVAGISSGMKWWEKFLGGAGDPGSTVSRHHTRVIDPIPRAHVVEEDVPVPPRASRPSDAAVPSGRRGGMPRRPTRARAAGRVAASRQCLVVFSIPRIYRHHCCGHLLLVAYSTSYS
jgi:hypothetical protein